MTAFARPLGLIAVAKLLVVLSACGGNGGGRLFSGGKICSLNPEPVSMEIDKAEKISLKPEDKSVSYGEYRFVSSEIYLKNRDTGVTIHAAQVPNERQGPKSPDAFVSSIQCARGFDRDTKPFSYEVDVVGHMSAKVDGSFQVKLKPIKIGFSDRIDMSFASPIDSGLTHPGKVYENSANEVIFYRTSENEQKKYEIRSLHQDGPVQIIVVVRFERADDPEHTSLFNYP